jgi:hypothetical protein
MRKRSTQRNPRLIATTIMFGSLLLMGACRGRDNPGANSGTAEQTPTRMSGDSAEIRTTDGTIRLGLVHDTIFMGLSDSVLALARTDMARDTETHNALAGTIERLVKKSVSSALKTRLKYPLADIDSAHYSNGMIKFAYRNRRTMAFEDVKQNDRKALASFSPEDAQSFVATVNSAIHKVRGTGNVH